MRNYGNPESVWSVKREHKQSEERKISDTSKDLMNTNNHMRYYDMENTDLRNTTNRLNMIIKVDFDEYEDLRL